MSATSYGPRPTSASTAHDALIETYWPPEEWDNAKAVLANMINYYTPGCFADPVNCVAPLSKGDYNCYDWQNLTTPQHAYGLWLIGGNCWDPAVAGSETPFLPEEWVQVLDPNYNTWMASVIWSIGGWGKFIGACDVRSAITDPIVGPNPQLCLLHGAPIPYPRNPVNTGGSAGLLVAVAALAAIGGLIYLDSTGVSL